MKHKQSILDLHFSYPTKFNTESFFIVSENDIMQRTLEDIYIIYQEYELKRVPTKEN